MSETEKKCGTLAVAAIALCISVAPRAQAQAAATENAQGALSSRNAVEIAVQNNPNLHVALLQETQARYAVTAEEALYDPIFDANANIAHNRNPGLLGTTSTIVTTT